MELLPGGRDRTVVCHRTGSRSPAGERHLTFVQLVAGFIYLLMGGDLLVRGSVALARRLNVPPVVVAATVVGFGTSLPELVVSLQATLSGYPNLILGNVVGSNIANVLLVGGAAATVYPLLHEEPELRRNVIAMVVSLVLFAALATTGELTRVGGAILLVAFALLMAATARSTIQAQERAGPSTPLDWVLGLPTRLGTIAMFIVLGVVGLPLGAMLLVEAAVQIAQVFAIPETVVGLTVLAIGTSLPELTTTVIAALERRADVAIGTIVGSNTFNVLAIMGLTAAVSPDPIPVSSRFLYLDVPVMLFTSGVVAFFAWRAKPIRRRVGIAMLSGYALYLLALYVLV